MAESSISQAFQSAIEHHQAGRLAEAERLYRQVLTQHPNHADALHLLGVIANQVGRHDVAVNLIRKAIALAPDRPAYYSNLGKALEDQGQLDQAVGAFRAAIQLKPDFAEAHYNLGNGLTGQGQLDQAIAAYRTAIQIRPDFAEAHNNLGNALLVQGQLDQAVAACRAAIRLKPEFAEAHNNLGNALAEQGQLDQAIAAFRAAIRLRPDFAKAHNNLGNALAVQGQLDQAIAACRTAIGLAPDLVDAHNTLGNALRGQGQLDQAVAAFRAAIRLKPDLAAAHNNLGNALAEQGQLDQAIPAFRAAIRLQPDLAMAHVNLGNALAGQGQLDQAIDALRTAIRLKSDYAEAHNNLGSILRQQGEVDQAIAAYSRAVELKPDWAGAHSNLVFMMHFHPSLDAAEIFRAHQRWNERHARPLEKLIQPHHNEPSPGRRLRLGYVSPDFRNHPVGRFMLPVLAHHDHTALEVFCYCDVRHRDDLTGQLRPCADVWRNIVGLSDPQVADMVRQDRIDILVDLAGHTADNRPLVFARKPAPVQVAWLGYPGTTGLSTMDYRLTDMVSNPPGLTDAFYTEQLIRLPDTYWCYQPADGTPEVNALPALSAGHVTFGCLNNFAKVTSVTLLAWRQLLRQMPNARLLLHCKEGSHRHKVRELLTQEGIDPARLDFTGLLPWPQYFQLYHRIDIALDTFPHGGGTTTCDALWMGVPVVTLAGQTAVSRAGLTILTNVGLAELAASNPEQYVTIAANLAGDLPRLAKLRSDLRQRMRQSPLMDAPRFARNIESAYREMWRHWCATIAAKE